MAGRLRQASGTPRRVCVAVGPLTDGGTRDADRVREYGVVVTRGPSDLEGLHSPDGLDRVSLAKAIEVNRPAKTLLNFKVGAQQIRRYMTAPDYFGLVLSRRG